MKRREFLVGTCLVASTQLIPLTALAGDVYHVVYPGPTTLQAAQEYLATLTVKLGPGVGRHLRIVKKSTSFLCVYDRSTVRVPGSKSEAQKVATAHNRILRAALDEDRTMASVLSAASMKQLWDIQYGKVTTLAALKAKWNVIAGKLGTGVAKKLAIEQVDGNLYRLVYKRAGDEASTRSAASRHSDLIKATGLTASAVPDAWYPKVQDGSTVEPSVSRAEPAPPPPKAAAPSSRGPSVSTTLSRAVNSHIQDYRRRGLVSSAEQTSWWVQDLSSDATLCSINADTPRQAASMIKPWVALAFLHEVKRGRFVYGPKSRLHMERMIRYSSNTSTNWMMEQLGGPRATQALLRRYYPRFSKSVTIVELIPADGRTYRNLVSVRDHGSLLRAIWHNQVAHARELRRVMNLPGPDRLYHGVPSIPVGTAVYNKTGTTAMCCGDMGILVARARNGRRIPYVMIGVIERSNRTSAYTQWSHDRGNVIRSVSGLVYEWLQGRHQLV